MSVGLAALLDDVAVLARAAAASTDDIAAATGRATVKATGVVIDDTAVTPQYVEGLEPARELPVIGRIALGSLGNKAIITVIALLLSQFVPWLLTPLLMCGGLYLGYEGAEKIWERLRGPGHHEARPAVEAGPGSERALVRSAVTTDFILSAEIMMITLDSVAEQPLAARAIILVVVGILITALVYGVVGIIVKIDDMGLALTRREGEGAKRVGRAMVRAMPGILATLAFVGMPAMLWVGGHILLTGADELGLHAPYRLVHHAAEAVHHLAGLGGVAAWVVETLASLIVGLLAGGLVLLVVHLLPRRRSSGAGA